MSKWITVTFQTTASASDITKAIMQYGLTAEIKVASLTIKTEQL